MEKSFNCVSRQVRTRGKSMESQHPLMFSRQRCAQTTTIRRSVSRISIQPVGLFIGFYTKREEAREANGHVVRRSPRPGKNQRRVQRARRTEEAIHSYRSHVRACVRANGRSIYIATRRDRSRIPRASSPAR